MYFFFSHLTTIPHLVSTLGVMYYQHLFIFQEYDETAQSAIEPADQCDNNFNFAPNYAYYWINIQDSDSASPDTASVGSELVLNAVTTSNYDRENDNCEGDGCGRFEGVGHFILLKRGGGGFYLYFD